MLPSASIKGVINWFEFIRFPHWLDKNGKILILDGRRTFLPDEMKPSEEITVNAKIITPKNPGDYLLEFDLVQEGIGWFKDKGSTTLMKPVKIE